MSHYIDTYTTWEGKGTPSDPFRPKPPSGYTSNQVSRWVKLQDSPLYIRFFINHDAAPTPTPTTVSPDLIKDKDVAPDAHIQEYKLDWNPMTGHNHDGTTKGGRRVSWKHLLDIPAPIQAAASGGGIGGGISGPYVASLNTLSGALTLKAGTGINIQAVAASGSEGPHVVINAEAGANIGLPSDGSYAGTVGLDASDTVANAFDKFDTFLSKLLPPVPPNLSDLVLVAPGAYSALKAGTGTLHNGIVASQTPDVAPASGFMDGNLGVLSVQIDGAASGAKTLFPANDVGTYGSLVITADADPYVGQTGKEGFYKTITAKIKPAAPLSLGGAGHTFRMIHSKTGSTPILTLFLDDPQAPSVGTPTFAGPASASRYVSGVPSLAVGEEVSASFVVGRTVSEYYNATRIASMASAHTTSANAPLPFTPPAKGANLSITNLKVAVNPNVLVNDLTLTLSAYNSKGDVTNAQHPTGMRVDTRSVESDRIKSGQGQFPIKGSTRANFGDPFDPTEPLTTPGNEELQIIGNVIQYPPKVDYSANKPFAGPNYQGIQPGTYANMRWYTVKLGSVTDVTGLTFDFQGATSFGTGPLLSGFAMQVKIQGASGTGWVDANAAYPGVGNPVNDGDPALVYNSSTNTRKVVTFGSAVRTGDVYVRIGIPSGSSKSFTGIVRV